MSAPTPSDAPPIDADLPIRVMLVDDQELIREAFGMVIDAQEDMEVIAGAGDGVEAVRQAEAHRIDVVLMDVRMPRMDGLEATSILLRRAPRTRVIMLTTFDIDEYVMEAIRAGASGFLLKDARPQEMLDAIRTVNRGDAVIAPSATKRLLGKLVEATPPEQRTKAAVLDRLTERERQVLVEMARGRTNSEIGEDLFVAEPTVKTHVSRILAKLGARDRVQAVIVAYETGLVSPGQSA